MKYTCRPSASVIDEESDSAVSPPRSLEGWVYEALRLGDYLDDEIADRGVIGGVIRFAVAEDAAQILVDYWSPAPLDDSILDALREYTAGQMSDGAGEGGFEYAEHDRRVRVNADLDRPIAVEQVDDGQKVPPPSRIAIAARKGDLPSLQEALAAGGEDVDAPYLGYTGLHLAILGGHVDAALTLLTHGADPNRPDPSDGAPLFLCAAANPLSDDGAARVAQALLMRGADPTRMGDAGLSARALAESRGKTLMAGVLPTAADH